VVSTRALILSRMQALMALGLEGTPSMAVIERTAEVWLKHLGIYSEARLSAAFDAVERTATRWPAVATIRGALPPETQERGQKVVNIGTPLGVQAQIDELANYFKRGMP